MGSWSQSLLLETGLGKRGTDPVVGADPYAVTSWHWTLLPGISNQRLPERFLPERERFLPDPDFARTCSTAGDRVRRVAFFTAGSEPERELLCTATDAR